jgi:hypothetical protein
VDRDYRVAAWQRIDKIRYNNLNYSNNSAAAADDDNNNTVACPLKVGKF